MQWHETWHLLSSRNIQDRDVLLKQWKVIASHRDLRRLLYWKLSHNRVLLNVFVILKLYVWLRGKSYLNSLFFQECPINLSGCARTEQFSRLVLKSCLANCHFGITENFVHTTQITQRKYLTNWCVARFGAICTI